MALLPFAVDQALHGQLREAQDRVRVPEQYPPERGRGQCREFRVAQRAHRRRARPRHDQTHLADGLARDDAADELAARPVHAEAAAHDEVDGVGGVSRLEQEPAARQGHPLELGDGLVDYALRKAREKGQRREHRPGVGPRVDLGPVVLGFHGIGTIA
jgi:hypothetical protein